MRALVERGEFQPAEPPGAPRPEDGDGADDPENPLLAPESMSS